MKIVFGILLGILWGGIGAFLDTLIMKNMLKQKNTTAIMLGNGERMVVDIAVLASVFLLRNVLPVSFVAMIIAAAVTLSMTVIVMSFRLARPDEKTEKDENPAEK